MCINVKVKIQMVKTLVLQYKDTYFANANIFRIFFFSKADDWYWKITDHLPPNHKNFVL